MLRMGSSKPLWDHSLEFKALVRSCTSNNIYMTTGQVPETLMAAVIPTILAILLNLPGLTGLCSRTKSQVTLTIK